MASSTYLRDTLPRGGRRTHGRFVELHTEGNRGDAASPLAYVALLGGYRSKIKHLIVGSLSTCVSLTEWWLVSGFYLLVVGSTSASASAS